MCCETGRFFLRVYVQLVLRVRIRALLNFIKGFSSSDIKMTYQLNIFAAKVHIQTSINQHLFLFFHKHQHALNCAMPILIIKFCLKR